MSLASLLELPNSSTSDLLRGLLALSTEFDALADGVTMRPKAASDQRPPVLMRSALAVPPSARPTPIRRCC